MQTSKKLLHIPHSLFMFSFFFITSMAPNTPTSISCGKIQIQEPFLSSNSSVVSPLNSMIVCKSEKLYFRTSLGLFPVSSIDYTTKTLIISQSTCSPTRRFISPTLLSAGFPSPPKPNSLILFNCSIKRHPISPLTRNCSHLHHTCGTYSCLLVDDIAKMDDEFHPKHLNCSHYRLVYRRSLLEDDHSYEGVELGTRISFDIPDHVPDICSECHKPNGNCGVGLRCICHAKECKDKVINVGRSLNPVGCILFSMFSFAVAVALFMDF